MIDLRPDDLLLIQSVCADLHIPVQCQGIRAAALAGMGADASSRARHGIPQVIVADVSIGNVHGTQMITAIRMFCLDARIPLLILSGDKLPGVAPRRLMAGRTACLEKPQDYDGYVQLVLRLHAYALEHRGPAA